MRTRTLLLISFSILMGWSFLLAQEKDKSKPTPTTNSQTAAQASCENQQKQETMLFLAQTKPFTADRHLSKGLECSACHGEVEKKRPVSSSKCLECHQSILEMAKPKDLHFYPHSNHLVESGDVECTDCHHGHKPNEIYCRRCHMDLNFECKAQAGGK
jgi:hypothetical protein